MEMDFQRSKEVADTLNAKTAGEITERAVVALREAIKAAMTINGASAVAILSYMGGVAAKLASGGIKVPQLQGPLLVFALGVLLSAAAFVPMHLYEERDLKIFHNAMRNRANLVVDDSRFKNTALWCVGASLLSFAAGCVLTAVLL
jgi:hypothetical protein